MDRGMERLQMDAQFDMMTSFLSVCREKTIKKSHNTESLSNDEKTQFANCLLKQMEAPNHIMSGIAGN